VAGYDLPRLLLGSWGTCGVILEVTMKLHARPVEVPSSVVEGAPPKFSPWALKVREAFDPGGRLNPGLIA
jgi:FAD/FMN-containing dehydrogenase